MASRRMDSALVGSILNAFQALEIHILGPNGSVKCSGRGKDDAVRQRKLQVGAEIRRGNGQAVPESRCSRIRLKTSNSVMLGTIRLSEP